MPPRSMFHKATGGLFEKKKPRAQAGQATIHDLPSHERRATIHDLPSHVLAHRVAAHLSEADAARLMQAAGRVHRGDLGHVMGQRKEEVEREAAPIVAAVRKLIEVNRHELVLHLPDGTRVFVRVGVNIHDSHPFLRGEIIILRSDTRTHLTFSPDVAGISTYGKGRIVETTPEDRRLLLEVLRQLTGKRVVTTWVKDAYGLGSTSDAGRDHARERRLVKDKTKANPGAVVVLLAGHLKR